MRHILIFGFLLLSCTVGFAQKETPKQLQETAKALLQKGDYHKAVLVLDRARQQEPNNTDVLKDISFANYLKRDFAKAIETGKQITESPDADQQSFQVLGLSYKAIASYKECAKLYKTALQKFPNSGMMYNEYAELLAIENNLDEAIVQWEKGVELDPGYSSNYYNATIYYIRSKNWIRALLYGELFLNLESYSTRTGEIKKQLPVMYKNLFVPGAINQLVNAKTTTTFEKTVLESLAIAANGTKEEINLTNIIGIRTRFMLDWVQDKQKRYPFRLFDNQQYLLSQGLLEAYNYWLLNTGDNAETYAMWLNNHPKENEAFKNFQQNRVFKIPVGQYYFSR